MASLLVCCGLLGVTQAQAQAQAHNGGDRDGTPRRDERSAPVREPHPQAAQHGDQRQAEPRQAEQARQVDPRSLDARAEEQRRAMQEAAGRNAEMSRRVGRLTPDERRDLRRQINEAGQDIYANPPRR